MQYPYAHAVNVVLVTYACGPCTKCKLAASEAMPCSRYTYSKTVKAGWCQKDVLVITSPDGVSSTAWAREKDSSKSMQHAVAAAFIAYWIAGS